MAIRTQSKNVQVIVDPLTFTAEIGILAGSVAQVYNRDTQDYQPSRLAVPLVLMPSVSTVDTGNTMTGEQPITNCEWYEGSPKGDGSNRIVDGDDYQISAPGYPKFSLKVMKDVPANTPLNINAIFSFIDKRKDTTVRIERNITIYTDAYSSGVYTLKINQPDNWVIDPIREIPNQKGEWKHTISAQLYSGSEEVPDEHAAYWWDMFENGVWKEVSNIEIGGEDEIAHPNVTLGYQYATNGTKFASPGYAVTDQPIPVRGGASVEIYTTLLDNPTIGAALVAFDRMGKVVDFWASEGLVRDCLLKPEVVSVALTFQIPPKNENPFYVRYKETHETIFKPLFKDTAMSGKRTKNLTFDARFFHEASFRCRAEYYQTIKPSVATDNTIQDITSVKVEYPKTLHVDILQTAGAKVNAQLSTGVSFECSIYDNKNKIPQNKYELFEIEWKAKSAQPGVPEKTVGYGQKISFVPNTLGFSPFYSIAVYAEVRMFSSFALYTCNGKAVITKDKKVIVQKIFK